MKNKANIIVYDIAAIASARAKADELAGKYHFCCAGLHPAEIIESARIFVMNASNLEEYESPLVAMTASLFFLRQVEIEIYKQEVPSEIFHWWNFKSDGRVLHADNPYDIGDIEILDLAIKQSDEFLALPE